MITAALEVNKDIWNLCHNIQYKHTDRETNMSRSRQYTKKELESLRRADLQNLYKVRVSTNMKLRFRLTRSRFMV